MTWLLDHPRALFVASFAALWLASWAGAWLGRRHGGDGVDREDFNLVLSAALTLLGLIIGFSFSMAISRYDTRKSLEEGEANAIGTAYPRADLLPAAEAAQLRRLLRSYLDARIAGYGAAGGEQGPGAESAMATLQSQLWATVREPAQRAPTPITALAMSGINDVINAQGYAQAAWWNRIPGEAWALLAAIALICNLLVGYGARTLRANRVLAAILPLVASVSFFLIADIDSPRGGIIRVGAQNLEALAASLPKP